MLSQTRAGGPQGASLWQLPITATQRPVLVSQAVPAPQLSPPGRVQPRRQRLASKKFPDGQIRPPGWAQPSTHRFPSQTLPPRQAAPPGSAQPATQRPLVQIEVGALQAASLLQLSGIGVTGSHWPVAALHTRSGGQPPAVQESGARATQLRVASSQRSVGAQPVSSLQPLRTSRALQVRSATSQY